MTARPGACSQRGGAGSFERLCVGRSNLGQGATIAAAMRGAPSEGPLGNGGTKLAALAGRLSAAARPWLGN